MTTAAKAAEAPGGSVALAGRTVARIGFGAMQLAEGRGDRPAPDRAVAITVLRSALEQGVNHIDTAQFYAEGACNALIRDALHPYPAGLVLASKVGAEHVAGQGLVAAQKPAQLRASVEENLATLGAEQLAVVNLRRLDQPPGILAEADQRVDLDSQLAELIALRDEGKIGGIGLSGVTPAQLRQALPAGIECVQNGYSVLDRSHEPLLEACAELHIAWVPFFPLGSAFPGRPKVTEHPVVIAVAKDLGATPAQVGLAWLLSRYERMLLIPGTASPAHLADNIAAGSVRLSPGAVAALDAIAAVSGPRR